MHTSQRLTPLAHSAHAIGVIGTRGGLGTSSLTALLAVNAPMPVSLLVDGAEASAGLDFTVGAHREAGLRWVDLFQISSDIDATTLINSLPQWDQTAVLSADHRGTIPSGPQAAYVLEASRQANLRCLIDMGTSLRAEVCRQLDAVVLVAGRDERSVRRAIRLLEELEPYGVPIILATMGRSRQGVADCEVADVVGLPVAHHVPYHRGMSGYQERGFGVVPGRARRVNQAVRNLWACVEQSANNARQVISL